MLYLTCGLPGSGKTLYTIATVKKRAEEEKRPVYYSRIAGVTLPGWQELQDVTKWHEVPAGSIVVMDECQIDFAANQRGKGVSVPAHVQAFSIARHKGLDVYLVTQDPMQFDHFIRRLCGVYWYVVRPFGMSYATVWQFESVQAFNAKDAASGFYDKISTKTRFDYPTDIFAAYKSAEVHTHKRRLPVAKLVGVGALVVGVVACGVVAYFTIKGFGSGGAVASAEVKKTPPGGLADIVAPVGTGPRHVVTEVEYLEARTPRVKGLPESAPIYDELATVVAFPRVAGCIEHTPPAGKGIVACYCVTQQGTPVYDVPMSVCRNFVARGSFDPYHVARLDEPLTSPDSEMEGRPLPADKVGTVSSYAARSPGVVVANRGNVPRSRGPAGGSAPAGGNGGAAHPR